MYQFALTVSLHPHICVACTKAIARGERIARAGSQAFHMSCYRNKMYDLLDKAQNTVNALDISEELDAAESKASQST